MIGRMEPHEVITRRRKNLGLSQPQVAERIGMSLRNYARYEDAKKPILPTLDVADRLSEVLEISLTELAGHGVPDVRLPSVGWSAWQTWMNGEERVEFERLTIRQDGEYVRITGEADPAHIDTGSFPWIGEARLIRSRSLCGWYAATAPGVTSCGTIQLVFSTHGQYAVGRWSGLSHDGVSESGWGAMAFTEELTRAAIEAIRPTKGTVLADFPDLPEIEFSGSNGKDQSDMSLS